MNVVMISCVRMNPYTRLLAAALQQVEPGLTCAHEEALTPAVVGRWRGQAQVFHLHWAELLYSSSRWHASRKLAAFLAGLMQARRAGIRLVYTAHNVERHETGHWLFDRLADAALYRLVDAVHVHDEESRQRLVQRYHLRRVEVIPHGSYIGAYADACTANEARQRLGIPASSFVFLALGQIRPYKGLDNLIAAFRQVPGEDRLLLIAGHPHDPAYGAALTTMAADDPRIRLHLAFVPDDEVQYYMRAADVCVLPYRSATTSGAAILAFSFARPVIAPDLGPFHSLVAPGSGILYPARPSGLQDALVAAANLNTEQASAAALGVARSLDWQPIARQHLALYRAITQ